LAALANPKYSKSKPAGIADDLKSYITSWTANFSRCDGMDKRRLACPKALAFSKSVVANSFSNLPATAQLPARVKLIYVKFPSASPK
jgi:hypothetical protein